MKHGTKSSIDRLLAEYLYGPGLDDRDEWDEDTASETPKALGDLIEKKKRSGEYLKAEFVEALSRSKEG